MLEVWELFGDESKSLMGQGTEGPWLLHGLIDHGGSDDIGAQLVLDLKLWLGSLVEAGPSTLAA